MFAAERVDAFSRLGNRPGQFRHPFYRCGGELGKLGKITAVYGKHIKVFFDGIERDALIRGKLLRQRLTSSPIAVGDNVEVNVGDGRSITIERVLPRRQILARPDLLARSKEQIIATNLDQLVIVASTRSPAFKAGLIDRFLVSAEKENLQAVIVINKIDLAPRKDFENFAEAWESLGYKAIFTSAVTRVGLADLQEVLTHKESALAGHSGVGKSTLINSLQPGLDIKTRRISTSGRGTHTTTAVMMYPLDFGGWVVDTPGLKVFGLAGIDKRNLAQYFPEMSNLAGQCRFGDCQHINEPDCAVKQAVSRKSIFPGRYDSYKRLWEQLEVT